MSEQLNPAGARGPNTGILSVPDDPDAPTELTFTDEPENTERWLTVDVGHAIPVGGGECR